MAPFKRSYDILKTITLAGRVIEVGVYTRVSGFYRPFFSQTEFDATIERLKRAPSLVLKKATKVLLHTHVYTSNADLRLHSTMWCLNKWNNIIKKIHLVV
ncbi:hypothetical protein GGTG_04514 [Gaeumannomyces tritici R3-111a-1]|uniref:Uncharacterized protein n=1 Tax=Gaeumannomyces tritici (strain R3-111a-1) TaxID=644352 RepID=J3NTB5_GAET3|nr:hypothetical protein GGTG_04514 [Gaeumannomyces tritici R3-111a-1]EJT79430.1 hypothetical protein GGTG_04514 [Gaeumannomyces tritici R3-111a-1]